MKRGYPAHFHCSSKNGCGYKGLATFTPFTRKQYTSHHVWRIGAIIVRFTCPACGLKTLREG